MQGRSVLRFALPGGYGSVSPKTRRVCLLAPQPMLTLAIRVHAVAHILGQFLVMMDCTRIYHTWRKARSVPITPDQP